MRIEGVRLRKMSDAELLRFGGAARYMCSPQANLEKPPRPEFVIQLEESRAEWKHRQLILCRDEKR